MPHHEKQHETKSEIYDKVPQLCHPVIFVDIPKDTSEIHLQAWCGWRIGQRIHYNQRRIKKCWNAIRTGIWISMWHSSMNFHASHWIRPAIQLSPSHVRKVQVTLRDWLSTKTSEGLRQFPHHSRGAASASHQSLVASFLNIRFRENQMKLSQWRFVRSWRLISEINW